MVPSFARAAMPLGSAIATPSRRTQRSLTTAVNFPPMLTPAHPEAGDALGEQVLELALRAVPQVLLPEGPQALSRRGPHLSPAQSRPHCGVRRRTRRRVQRTSRAPHRCRCTRGTGWLRRQRSPAQWSAASVVRVVPRQPPRRCRRPHLPDPGDVEARADFRSADHRSRIRGDWVDGQPIVETEERPGG